ncbi:hypothetical protein WG66_011017 [Moniliophthora roreri]|nr:hypothetical protein WG66_000363 [Moniliophthora roreri]KAI3609081.1 hypothetical protein WG66_011017 [Moniliophthora roreri]
MLIGWTSENVSNISLGVKVHGRLPKVIRLANYFVQKGEDTLKIPRERFTEIQNSAMLDIEKKFSCERVVKHE